LTRKATPASPHEVVVERGEQLLERTLAAEQQHMRMPRLWRPGPMRRGVRQKITFQKDDCFKPIGQNPGGGDAGDARANNDGLRADVSGADPTFVRNALLLHVELLTLCREDARSRALPVDVRECEKRYRRNIWNCFRSG
jgi:hypothetical protein